MASSRRPKRQCINVCINDNEIVNELCCDELSDFSEINDSNADREYFPFESENSVASSLGLKTISFYLILIINLLNSFLF
jgi:hypothetical protein